MLAAVLQFIAASLVVVVSGILLARFADAISQITGLGRMFAGVVLLATATSMPELSVGISAARQGLVDVAVSGLIGSSLMNLLILGILDLLYRSKSRVLSALTRMHTVTALLSLGLTAVVGMAILSRSTYSVLNLGMGSFGLVVFYLVGTRWLYRASLFTVDGSDEEQTDVPVVRRGLLTRSILGYLGAAAAIMISAPFLAEAAGQIAELSGVSQTFIGTTLVALSTSLPEVVTTMASLRLGSVDMAAGNIFGSNTFNMVLLSGVDASIPGSIFGQVSLGSAMTCVSAILVTSVIVFGQLLQLERRILGVELDALMVIGLVFLSLIMAYQF